MDQSVLNSTQSNNETGIYFNPEDYFLGIAKRITKSQASTRVSLPGNGEIAIFPGRGEFHSSVQDMAKFCLAPVSDFEVVTLNERKDAHLSTQPPSGKIRELLWTAAFHASQGRLDKYRSDNAATHILDVISFTHWPNLTRLPVSPNTMRICALLTRHPTSIGMIARKLRINQEEAYQVYSAASSYGIVNCLSCDDLKSDADYDDVADEQGDPVQKQRNLFQALFAKVSGL